MNSLSSSEHHPPKNAIRRTISKQRCGWCLQLMEKSKEVCTIHSQIGEGVAVGEQTVVEYSTIQSGAKIGARCLVSSVVLPVGPPTAIAISIASVGGNLRSVTDGMHQQLCWGQRGRGGAMYTYPLPCTPPMSMCTQKGSVSVPDQTFLHTTCVEGGFTTIVFGDYHASFTAAFSSSSLLDVKQSAAPIC